MPDARASARQRGEIGLERGDLVRALEHRVDVGNPVVVDGDREDGPLDAEGAAETPLALS